MNKTLYLKHQDWIKSDGFITKVNGISAIKYNLSFKIAISKQINAKSLNFTPKPLGKYSDNIPGCNDIIFIHCMVVSQRSSAWTEPRNHSSIFFYFLCVSLFTTLPTKLYDKNTISDYDTNLLPKYSISD